MSPRNSQTLLPLLLTVVCAIAGCGTPNPQPIGITGTVQVANQPLAKGTITLMPSDGESGRASSTSIVGGEFCFDTTAGPVPGSYQVIVMSNQSGQIAEDSDPPSPRNKAKMQNTVRPDIPTGQIRSRKIPRIRRWQSKVIVNNDPSQSMTLNF